MVFEGRGKINLALNVEGTMPNGYHQVKMVLQEISLSDRISIEFGRPSVTLQSNSSAIPSDSRNIAYRAAELFMEKTGCDGADIYIEKVIPSEAGLAGGSADGAAVLRAMNGHYGNPLTDAELADIGLKLGADVPFCLMGGCALAEGVGEILTPIQSKIKTDILIVKPDVGISTPFAYRRLDEVGFNPVDVDSVVSALAEGDTAKLCVSMGNVFETVAREAAPEVFDIKADLIRSGAEGAMMSGSGTAVFGIFTNKASLHSAYDFFKDRYVHTYKAKML